MNDTEGAEVHAWCEACDRVILDTDEDYYADDEGVYLCAGCTAEAVAAADQN